MNEYKMQTYFRCFKILTSLVKIRLTKLRPNLSYLFYESERKGKKCIVVYLQLLKLC